MPGCLSYNDRVELLQPLEVNSLNPNQKRNITINGKKIYTNLCIHGVPVGHGKCTRPAFR